MLTGFVWALPILAVAKMERPTVRYAEEDVIKQKNYDRKTVYECGDRKPIRVAGFVTNPPFGWMDIISGNTLNQDRYVNDGFGTAHRAHASTALIADYFDTDNKMFGYLMEKEVKAVDKVMNDIQRPFTAIMGGSKVSSKIEIIENLLNKVDNLIITGGMTYTFTKAQGGKIGKSICEDDKLDLALDLIKKAKEKGVNLVLAVDAKIADDFSNDAKTDFAPVDQIPDGWEGLDIGPKTEAIYADVIKNSKTILWNGPTGVFEFENFTHGSRTVGEAIVEATKNGAFSLVGGGDSVACVNKFGLANGVSYVSTGGGALLEAIEGKVLPGIAAVKGEAYK